MWMGMQDASLIAAENELNAAAKASRCVSPLAMPRLRGFCSVLRAGISCGKRCRGVCSIVLICASALGQLACRLDVAVFRALMHGRCSVVLNVSHVHTNRALDALHVLGWHITRAYLTRSCLDRAATTSQRKSRNCATRGARCCAAREIARRSRTARPI